MSRFRFISYILIVLISISCKHKQTKTEIPLLTVETHKVEVDSLYNRINSASQIEGLYNAVIQPRVNGFLISTHFEGGAPVKRGDLLFTIDPSSFATSLYAAKASLESAKASEMLAKRNYERAEPLATIYAISQSDLDQYRATYKSAVASTKSAEEALRSAELEIGYTRIYAPISGIAAKTSASTGDYIGPGTLLSELTTISQLDTVCVEVPIPTAKYLKYIPSESSNSFDNSTLLSDITMTLPDSSLYEYPGEYYYTLKNTPQGSSTVVIVIKFPNPNLMLKEGMFARINANIGTKMGCTVVPKDAVSQLQGVNSVWVIQPDSTAQWREVSLGETYGSMWDITSGISQGESVVVSGDFKLHNGLKVASREAK